MNRKFSLITLATCMMILPWFVGAIFGHIQAYVEFQDYNANFVATNCTLEQASAHTSFHFEPCKCKQICMVQDVCSSVCQQCLEPNFVAWQEIKYSVENVNSTMVVVVTKILDGSFESLQAAEDALVKSGTVGSTWACYYSRKSFLWQEFSAPISNFQVPIISIIFYIFGCVFAIGWIVLTIYWRRVFPQTINVLPESNNE